MGKIWYLSPSNQSANVGINGYGTEKDQMYRLVDAITPHLDRAGVSFHVANGNETIQQRCTESNAMDAGFHLCLHSNAGGSGKACGPVALYYSDSGKVFGEKLVTALLNLGQQNNRSSNLVQNKTLYELRKTVAPACLLEVDFHDSSTGVTFLTKRRSEIAEAIAKVIIEADGKEFVPITTGEYIDEAVKLGLFQSGTDWQEPITKEEAATLAVRLKNLIEKGGDVMKQTVCTAVGAIGAGLAWAFGGWDTAMMALLICIAVDYASGSIVALVFHKSSKTETGSYNSAYGVRGLFKKGLMLLFVLVAVQVDRVLGTDYVRNAVCIGFCTNEIISITENLGLAGIPMPEVMTKALEQLQKK